jgi:hypothetical protein
VLVPRYEPDRPAIIRRPVAGRKLPKSHRDAKESPISIDKNFKKRLYCFRR